MKTRQVVRRAVVMAAFALFPVTLYYLSPVLSLEGIASGIVTGSLVVFFVQLVAAAVIGRAFCGWACPGGGLQELVARVRKRRVNRSRIAWMKWAVWGPWVLALVFFALRAGGVHALDFTYQTRGGISVTDAPGAIALLSVILVFFVLSAAMGRRAGCHVLCWMAPFMIIGRRVGTIISLPSLRLTARPEACRECGKCTAGCPMSIEVERLVASPSMAADDCILCGSCADACPRKVIHFSFGSGQ